MHNRKFSVLLTIALLSFSGLVSFNSAYATPFVGTPSPSLGPVFGTLIDFDDKPPGTVVTPIDYSDKGVISIQELEGLGTFARYPGSQSLPNYVGTGPSGDRLDNFSGWDGTILIKFEKPASMVGIGISDMNFGPEYVTIYDKNMVILESVEAPDEPNVYVGFDRQGFFDIKYLEITGDFFAIDDLQFDYDPSYNYAPVAGYSLPINHVSLVLGFLNDSNPVFFYMLGLGAGLIFILILPKFKLNISKTIFKGN